jgi:hypothetical protein
MLCATSKTVNGAGYSRFDPSGNVTTTISTPKI